MGLVEKGEAENREKEPSKLTVSAHTESALFSTYTQIFFCNPAMTQEIEVLVGWLHCRANHMHSNWPDRKDYRPQSEKEQVLPDQTVNNLCSSLEEPTVGGPFIRSVGATVCQKHSTKTL